MANGGPHTNSAQFYITLGDRSYLDGDYTVFGEVVEGMAVVDSIVQDDAIENIRIERIGVEAESFVVDTTRFRGLVQAATRRVAKQAEERTRATADYIRENWPTAITTASGMQYAVVQQGAGDSPIPGATITLRYSGHTLSGLRFCSTNDGAPTFGEEGQPFFFEIGIDTVTAGFAEGVSEMRTGEQRVLIVPASLAYGRGGHYASDRPGERRFHISPNTMLVYEVERIRQASSSTMSFGER